VKPRTNVIWGFVALGVAMLIGVADARANEAMTTKQWYSFGVSPRAWVHTDHGYGMEVGALECGSLAVGHIQRGDQLVNIDILDKDKKKLDVIYLANVTMQREPRVAVFDVVRGNRVIHKSLILMNARSIGETRC